MKLYCVTAVDQESNHFKFHTRDKDEDDAVLRFVRECNMIYGDVWTLDDIDEIHEHYEWTIEVEEIRDAPRERAGVISPKKIEEVISQAIRTAKF